MVAAITEAVTAAVAAAVVTAVAGAAVGASAGGAGGGVAGGAGGGAGGGGGAAGGGVAPLILGVQRFGASSGLAANKSELQSGVAGGMGWASGSFSIFGGSSDGEGTTQRQLAELISGRMLQRRGGGGGGNAFGDGGGSDFGSGYDDNCADGIFGIRWTGDMESAPCIPQVRLEISKRRPLVMPPKLHRALAGALIGSAGATSSLICRLNGFHLGRV